MDHAQIPRNAGFRTCLCWAQIHGQVLLRLCIAHNAEAAHYPLRTRCLVSISPFASGSLAIQDRGRLLIVTGKKILSKSIDNKLNHLLFPPRRFLLPGQHPTTVSEMKSQCSYPGQNTVTLVLKQTRKHRMKWKRQHLSKHASEIRRGDRR